MLRMKIIGWTLIDTVGDQSDFVQATDNNCPRLNLLNNRNLLA